MYGICEYFTKTMSGRFEGGETVIMIPLDRQALEAVLYGTVGTYLDLTVLFLLRLYSVHNTVPLYWQTLEVWCAVEVLV